MASAFREAVAFGPNSSKRTSVCRIMIEIDELTKCTTCHYDYWWLNSTDHGIRASHYLSKMQDNGASEEGLHSTGILLCIKD